MALPNKRGSVEGDLTEPAPKKHKKTVTWAGDVPTSSAELDGLQSSGGGEVEPPVVVLQQLPDSLFAELDEHALGQQVDVPEPSAAALSYAGLLQHRIDNIDRLYKLYEAELWSLYDELHLRQQQQQQGKEGEDQGDQASISAAAAAEEGGARQQQSPAATNEAQQSMGLRQLYRQRLLAASSTADAVGAHSKPQPQRGQEQQADVARAVAAPALEGQQVEAGAAAGGKAAVGGLPEQQPAAEHSGGRGQSAEPHDAGHAPQQGPPQQQQLPPAQAGGLAAMGVVGSAPAGEARGPVGQEGQQQQQQQALHSTAAAHGEERLPAFEEVEEFILGLGADAVPAPRGQLVQQRAALLRHLGLIGRLEQSVLGSLCRELDTFGAVAALCGRRQRYLLRRTAVLLGRSTESQGKVDVDLSGEGHSQTVSRQQAQLVLEADGTFRLRCLGRRSVFVNGRQLAAGGCVALPHLSLLKAGGVSLLFIANRAAVQRALRRSAALSV